MSDDLVTRLREQSVAEYPLFTRSLMQEAVTEIERLRADNKHAQSSLNEWMTIELQALLNTIECLRADRDKWAELAKKYAASHRKLNGLEKAWDNE